MNEENIRTEITWHGRKVRIIAVSTRQKIFICYIVMQDSIHYSLFITYKRKINILRDVLLAERSITLPFSIILIACYTIHHVLQSMYTFSAVVNVLQE